MNAHLIHCDTGISPVRMELARAECLCRAIGILLLVLVGFLFPSTVSAQSGQSIDRHALVSRHNVTVTSFDPQSPLSVGNGEFAFTVDPTGLQTFPELYSANNQTPLCTMAQWGWHTIPLPENLKGSSLCRDMGGYQFRCVQILNECEAAYECIAGKNLIVI